jgi:hypothetical protein
MCDDGYTAVDSASRVSDEVSSALALEVPDLASVAGIEREAFVGGGDVHDAFDDHGCDFEIADAGHVEDPTRGEAIEVRLVDLVEPGEAVPAGVAVVGGPVSGGCDFAILFAGLAEQVETIVVGAELGAIEGTVDD